MLGHAILDSSERERMDTLRIDICYRPLRLGWVIRVGDFDALRQVFRLSHTLWDGRFNPILVVDEQGDVKDLVELFGVDFLWPAGDTEPVNPGRVPGMYLGSAVSRFFSLLLFRRINKLCVFNALGSSIPAAPTNFSFQLVSTSQAPGKKRVAEADDAVRGLGFSGTNDGRILSELERKVSPMEQYYGRLYRTLTE